MSPLAIVLLAAGIGALVGATVAVGVLVLSIFALALHAPRILAALGRLISAWVSQAL